MQTFDALDRKILAALDVDGRAAISDIARFVRHGRDIVSYRVQRLQREGILLGAEPIIDPGVLGFGLYKTYLSFAQADKALQRVHDRVRVHPQAYCLARAQGRWDLLFNMVATSAIQYAEIRSQLLGPDVSQVREIGFALFTHMTYFNRKYLASSLRSWTTMAAPKALEVDAVERRILSVLAEDARRTDTELAELVGVSPIVFRYRLARLSKAGIILGFRARLDRAAFGLSSYKLHITLLDLSERTTNRIHTFAEKHPHVSQFMLQLGTWSCEMNVEAHDAKHLGEIVDELRSALGDRIGLVEITLYDRDAFIWGFGEPRKRGSILQPTVANAA